MPSITANSSTGAKVTVVRGDLGVWPGSVAKIATGAFEPLGRCDEMPHVKQLIPFDLTAAGQVRAIAAIGRAVSRDGRRLPRLLYRRRVKLISDKARDRKWR